MSQLPPPTPLGYQSPTSAEAASGRTGLAVASLVCGIVSVVVFPCLWSVAVPLLLGITAVVLGLVARRQARRGVAGGRGMALAGLICGSAGAGGNVLAYAAIAALLVSLGRTARPARSPVGVVPPARPATVPTPSTAPSTR